MKSAEDTLRGMVADMFKPDTPMRIAWDVGRGDSTVMGRYSMQETPEGAKLVLEIVPPEDWRAFD